jgi:hypothetical protein
MEMSDKGPRADDIAIILRDIYGADDWLARGACALGLGGTPELSAWIGGAPPPERLYDDVGFLWAAIKVNRIRNAHGGRDPPSGFHIPKPAGLSPAMKSRLHAWFEYEIAGIEPPDSWDEDEEEPPFGEIKD